AFEMGPRDLSRISAGRTCVRPSTLLRRRIDRGAAYCIRELVPGENSDRVCLPRRLIRDYLVRAEGNTGRMFSRRSLPCPARPPTDVHVRLDLQGSVPPC